MAKNLNESDTLEWSDITTPSNYEQKHDGKERSFTSVACDKDYDIIIAAREDGYIYYNTQSSTKRNSKRWGRMVAPFKTSEPHISMILLFPIAFIVMIISRAIITKLLSLESIRRMMYGFSLVPKFQSETLPSVVSSDFHSFVVLSTSYTFPRYYVGGV